MTGLLLRLAGPLQSWGEHSTFSERDTCWFPTRSGLTGLLASALGRHRTDPIDDLAALRFTVRIDRPGESMVDFHTVGGGLPRERTVPTADGKRRGSEATTIVSRRHYLANAVFMVAVDGPPDLLASAAAALQAPVWAPYLGRRSCPAEAPLLVRADIEEPIRELRTRLPLPRQRPRHDQVQVTFVHEEPSSDSAGLSRVDLNDIPVTFDPQRRRYTGRAVYIERARLPADLCAGLGRRYLTALEQYLNPGEGGHGEPVAGPTAS